MTYIAAPHGRMDKPGANAFAYTSILANFAYTEINPVFHRTVLSKPDQVEPGIWD